MAFRILNRVDGSVLLEGKGDLRDTNLSRTNLLRADLCRADLRGARLDEADLREADLSCANLTGAELRGANLHAAQLSGANLRAASLSWANLSLAALCLADLSSADLRCADLRDANLRSANLNGAFLWAAQLRGAHLPSPTDVLHAAWGVLSDALTIRLMRYDASCHPDPKRFTVWAQGGVCPYSEVAVQRAALFVERRDLWSPELLSLPHESPYALMAAVLQEKCSGWEAPA